MSVNPGYLAREHPVRVLLEQAAAGRQPSQRQLDQLEEVSALLLPDGHSLSRFRRYLSAGAEECAAITARGAHAEARRRAAELVSSLAVTMSEEERAVDTSEPNPEPVDSIAARMFNH